jgi:glycosyltransferase involved in cell wall biosynthesis
VLEGKTVAVVVPCYKEQGQITGVLQTMPDFVDGVIVVDDHSPDDTAEVVRRYAAEHDQAGRIVLIERQANGGVGAAIVTGYKEAVRRRFDATAVMAGDGQMDPAELHLLAGPVVRGLADYTKGNRLFYDGVWQAMPKYRYLGNAFLSMLTKIASGYWHVADSQTGYTVVSLKALQTIDLDALYPRFGFPNDMLVRLNVYDFRVADVPVRPLYNIGERSKIRLWKVIPTMSWMIFKRFLWRMKEKYIIHDFHPLVLFYLATAALVVGGAGLFVRLVWLWVANGRIPPMNALAWALCTISATQFSLFAMWFDMERNRHLRVDVSA